MKIQSCKLPSRSSDVVWVLLHGGRLGNRKILFLGVYFSPENSPYAETDLLSLIYEESCLHRLEHGIDSIIWTGDVNARTATIPDFDDRQFDSEDSAGFIDNPMPLPLRANRDKVVNTRGRKLIEICKLMNVRILNGRCGLDNGIGNFTCVRYNGRSVVDYVIVTEDIFPLITHFEIGHREESDHFPVLFNLSLGEEYCERGPVNYPVVKRLKWKDHMKDEYFSQLERNEVNFMINDCHQALASNNVLIALEILYKIVWICAQKMEVKPFNGKPSLSLCGEKWFDNDCRKQKQLVRSLKNSYRRDGCNFDEFREQKAVYRTLTRSKKREFDFEIRSKLNEALESKDQKAFWSFLKGSGNGVQDAIDPMVLYEYFKELYASFVVPSQALVRNWGFLYNETLDKSMTTLEVGKALQSQKSGKASGPDGVPAEFWKNSETLLPLIVQIFQNLYLHGVYPDEWRLAMLKAIYKKGDPLDPDNYRGVSLTCCLGKCLGGVLANRLKSWASETDFWSPFQSGFREKHSTLDNVFVLSTVYSQYVQGQNKTLFVAFIDFRKCFDSLDRETMWEKFQSFGLSTRFMNMLKAMFTDVKSCIKVNTSNAVTDYFDCPAGVRQGCTLSPLLFIMFVNDLSTFMEEKGSNYISLGLLKLFLMFFADDLSLYDYTVKGLQRKLNYLSEYCAQWGLHVNMKKSNVLVFAPKRHAKESRVWTYRNEEMAVANDYPYLGIQVQDDMSWEKAKKSVVLKARRALYSMYGKIKKMGGIDSKVLLKIFDSKIVPILLFGCELWGLGDISSIEKVANDFYRHILCIPCNTCIAFCRGELGRVSLKITIYVRILKYWLKILKSNPSTPMYQSYISQWNSTCSAFPIANWALKLKTLLYTSGFGTVWETQRVVNEKAFVSEFRQRLVDMETQTWRSQVATFGALRTYKLVKCDLKLEPYLNSNVKDLQLYTRLRGGLLPILVNEGRWRTPKINFEDRICTLCNRNEVENEEHVLISCPALSSFRAVLRVKCRNVCSFDFRNLVASQNATVVRAVCKFLKSVIEFREEILSIL